MRIVIHNLKPRYRPTIKSVQHQCYTRTHARTHPCSTGEKLRFFSNIIGLPERINKRKSVLEITKMYYFKI